MVGGTRVLYSLTSSVTLGQIYSHSPHLQSSRFLSVLPVLTLCNELGFAENFTVDKKASTHSASHLPPPHPLPRSHLWGEVSPPFDRCAN